jgi:cytochrome P450
LDNFLTTEEVRERKRAINWHDMPNHAKYVQTSLLDSDGVQHARLRKVVLGLFSRRNVERHRTMIQKYVNKLLDKLLEKKQIDFIEELAAHVPGHIIGNVLGVPDEDCPQLRAWSENVVQFFDIDRTPEQKQMAERATKEFVLYLSDLIKIRSRNPKDDLISVLIAAKNANDLTETELISTCMLILMAGHGSTIDVLGSGMNALLRHPQQLERLRENSEHIHTAVQEMFRFEAPLPFFHRYAADEVELFGKHYPQGAKFGLLYGSANRDSDVFPSANSFDITRTPNRHIAFGRGPHLCLGNNLARLDMEVIFLTLLKRTSSIDLLLDETKFKKSLSARGPVTLPIQLTPTQ